MKRLKELFWGIGWAIEGRFEEIMGLLMIGLVILGITGIRGIEKLYEGMLERDRRNIECLREKVKELERKNYELSKTERDLKEMDEVCVPLIFNDTKMDPERASKLTKKALDREDERTWKLKHTASRGE